MSTARTRSVQRREEAASDAKERRNHQNLLSKWRAKVQSGETQPVVWQPGVSLDLEATQRTFDVVYGGKVLLVELAAHDERTIDVDALLGAHATVVLHDGQWVQLVAEPPLPAVVRKNNAISRKRWKGLVYDPSQAAAKRSCNVDIRRDTLR